MLPDYPAAPVVLLVMLHALALIAILVSTARGGAKRRPERAASPPPVRSESLPPTDPLQQLVDRAEHMEANGSSRMRGEARLAEDLGRWRQCRTS